MENILSIESDKVKNLIIEILSAEWPLTAKKIYNKVRKEHKKNVSYQAVFKALKEMQNRGILKKDKYDYGLNIQWINEACSKYEDIKRIYEGKHNKNIFLRFIKEKTFTLEFDTYYSALSTLLQLMDKVGFLARASKNGNYIEARHLYWPFAGSEKEQEKMRVIFKTFNAHVLCNSKTPLDKIVRAHYKKLDPTIKIVLGKIVAKDHETIITGNFVGQIFYQKDFVKCLDKIYKNNNLIKVSEIYELFFNKKTKITVVITKNSEFADLERIRIMRVMGEKSVL